MKKILVSLLCLGFLLTGCSSDNKSSGDNSSSTSTSLKAEEGDIVKIDYEGKLNGTAFQGGTASGQLLELGSNTFIDGFEEQLIGMKAGEEKTITVTFPDNYQSSELAGKECTFDVAVNHIYREVK